jgi:hypothetical protein
MMAVARKILSFLSVTAILAACSSNKHSSPVDAAPQQLACGGGLGAYDSTLVAQIDAASYVFAATVTAVQGTKVVVHVDAVAYAGPDIAELNDTWGTTVTIDLQTGNLGVGARVFFLTQLSSYDARGLEVLELGRVDTTRFPQFAVDVPRIKQLFAANPLYARVATSCRIVTGGVGAIDTFDSACTSEHCPVWQLAAVDVAEILGGPAISARALDVGFASSRDVAWYQAPKLAAGQQGVLLLHRPVAPVPFSTATPQLIVIDPLDVHPMSDEATITNLIENPPALP